MGRSATASPKVPPKKKGGGRRGNLGFPTYLGQYSGDILANSGSPAFKTSVNTIQSFVIV
jgi:hypothetical protein